MNQDFENDNCTCPECGDKFETPHNRPRCICREPLYIVIQPGQHIHIKCPAHGDVKIYGPKATWLQMPPNGASLSSRWSTEYGKPSKSMNLTASMGPG